MYSACARQAVPPLPFMATLRTENGYVKVVEGGQAAAFGNVVLLLLGTIMTLTGVVKLLSVE